MCKYLVKLTPYDRFFFGGERTFGEKKESNQGNNEDKYTNYFVVSNYYPQQTAILGLLRYQLLVQEEKKLTDKERIKELIGPGSFNYESYTANNQPDFGKIKNISPLFICRDDNTFLFPGSLEYQYYKDKEKERFQFREFKREPKGSSSGTASKPFIPVLEEYDNKEDLCETLVNKELTEMMLYNYDSQKEKRPENGCFVPDRQVGIRKDYKGNTDEKAYYVQVYYRLIPEYAFAFIAELEESTRLLPNPLVSLGAEQSKFRMDITEQKEDYDAIAPVYRKSGISAKIVLTSDAYIKKTIFEKCDFAITKTVDFRNVRSTVDYTKNHADMDRNLQGSNGDIKSEKPFKSKKYELYKRGSVFYCGGDKIEAIAEEIKAEPFRTIGYNHYKIIKVTT